MEIDKTIDEAKEEIIGAVLIAKKDATRAEAERKFEEHRHKLPLVPSFKAGSDRVKDEAITMMTDLLLSPHVWGKAKDSWGVDGTDPSVTELDQLVAMGARADANYAVSTARQILPGTAAPARDDMFQTGNADFGRAIGRTAAPAAPSFAAPVPVGKSIVGPGLSLARRLELDAEVARDLSVAVNKALAASPVTKVAKAAPATTRTMRVIPRTAR